MSVRQIQAQTQTQVIENDEQGVPLPLPLQYIFGLSFLPYASSTIEPSIGDPNLQKGEVLRQPYQYVEKDENSQTSPLPLQEMPNEVVERQTPSRREKGKKKSKFKKIGKSVWKKLGFKSKKSESSPPPIEGTTIVVNNHSNHMSRSSSISHIDSQIAFIQSDLNSLSTQQQSLEEKIQFEVSHSSGKLPTILQRMEEMDRQAIALHQLMTRHLELMNSGRKEMEKYQSKLIQGTSAGERIEIKVPEGLNAELAANDYNEYRTPTKKYRFKKSPSFSGSFGSHSQSDVSRLTPSNSATKPSNFKKIRSFSSWRKKSLSSNDENEALLDKWYVSKCLS